MKKMRIEAYCRKFGKTMKEASLQMGYGKTFLAVVKNRHPETWLYIDEDTLEIEYLEYTETKRIERCG